MMTLTEHIRSVFTTGRRPGPRGFVAEWTITLLLVFFRTTTLVQAYVIPTGSMEGNLLIGDHMLVDRLAYSDPGIIGQGLLPYRSVRRFDIIAFRYPLDPAQAYVKRVIGLNNYTYSLIDFSYSCLRIQPSENSLAVIDLSFELRQQ